MVGSCSLFTKTWVRAVVVVIVIALLTSFAYTSSNTALQKTAQWGIESTAGVMATQINASEIQGFKPGDEMSPEYLAVASKLQSMRSMNDKILNAYILKVNPDRTVTFVVDDLYPVDQQGSAKIGEVSTAPDKMDILAALSGPTATKEPYTTKYGSFMTAYAPIDDSSSDSRGNTYAVLAIDVSAKDYMDSTNQGGWIIVTGIVSMFLAGGAILVPGRKAEVKKE
ncbi:MAG: hypothetical protein WC391_03780 [Methanoregula sp.]|jgi:hypothetical protein